MRGTRRRRGTTGCMRRIDVFATLLVTCVWGVAFVGIKKVLESGPPLTLAGTRFVLGGLLLLPLLARPGAGRPPTWREVAVVGLLQTTALYGCGFLGVQRATAGASALLLNTKPSRCWASTSVPGPRPASPRPWPGWRWCRCAAASAPLSASACCW